MKMWMKKIAGGFFCVLFGLMAAVAPVHGEDLQLYATAAVLMDADSGRVLYGKNEDAVMAMASTTKIMTCIIVLESVSQDDVVTVSSYAASMPKVKLYIQRGEQYTVRDLLRSLMLESHNDSAVALAEHVINGDISSIESPFPQMTLAYNNLTNKLTRTIGSLST